MYKLNSCIPEYNLLVDQCATELPDLIGSDTTSCADTSLNTSFNNLSGIDGNNMTTATYSGDIVTTPSRQNLFPGDQYVYYIDGNPSFPHEFDKSLFFPSEPDVLSAHFAEISVWLLRSRQRIVTDEIDALYEEYYQKYISSEPSKKIYEERLNIKNGDNVDIIGCIRRMPDDLMFRTPRFNRIRYYVFFQLILFNYNVIIP